MGDVVVVNYHRQEEVFVYTIPNEKEPLRWDVLHAKALIGAGEKVGTVTVELDQMAIIARKNDWDPAHLPNVDPSRPGIGAPCVFEGRRIYILIDGTHRCVRSLMEGRAFVVDLLTDAASLRCFIDGPRKYLPGAELG